MVADKVLSEMKAGEWNQGRGRSLRKQNEIEFMLSPGMNYADAHAKQDRLSIIFLVLERASQPSLSSRLCL